MAFLGRLVEWGHSPDNAWHHCPSCIGWKLNTERLEPVLTPPPGMACSGMPVSAAPHSHAAQRGTGPICNSHLLSSCQSLCAVCGGPQVAWKAFQAAHWRLARADSCPAEWPALLTPPACTQEPPRHQGSQVSAQSPAATARCHPGASRGRRAMLARPKSLLPAQQAWLGHASLCNTARVV